MTPPADDLGPANTPRGKAARSGRPPANKVPAEQVAADKAGDDVAPAAAEARHEQVPGAAAGAGDVPEDAAGAPQVAGDAADGETGGHPAAEPDAPGGYSSVDSPAAVQTGTPEPVGGAERAPSENDAAGAATDTAAADVALAEPTPPGGSIGAPTTGVGRSGMFMARDGGDTSGFGGLVVEPYTPAPAERPYGGYFDEVADALTDAMAERSIPADGDRAGHHRQPGDDLLPGTHPPHRVALGPAR